MRGVVWALSDSPSAPLKTLTMWKTFRQIGHEFVFSAQDRMHLS